MQINTRNNGALVCIFRDSFLRNRESAYICAVLIFSERQFLYNIRQMKRYMLWVNVALIMLIIGSCDLMDTHPYSVHITGDRNLNDRNIRFIEEACKNKDTIRFVLTGDTQAWFDETYDMVRCINEMGNIDFVVHGGDLSDFGMTEEFLWQRDLLRALDCPFVVIIGNHDCIGTGKLAYQKVFGKPNFSFKVGKIRFICLNTNALEFDYSEPIPDLGYMRKLLRESESDSTWQYTVVSMHAQPGADVFNNNVKNTFQEIVRRYPMPLFCTAAHDHNVGASELFNDGIIYHRSTSMDDRMFTLITIMGNRYKYEYISF